MSNKNYIEPEYFNLFKSIGESKKCLNLSNSSITTITLAWNWEEAGFIKISDGDLLTLTDLGKEIIKNNNIVS